MPQGEVNTDWSIHASWGIYYTSWGMNKPIRAYLTLRHGIFASWGIFMPQVNNGPMFWLWCIRIKRRKGCIWSWIYYLQSLSIKVFHAILPEHLAVFLHAVLAPKRSSSLVKSYLPSLAISLLTDTHRSSNSFSLRRIWNKR